MAIGVHEDSAVARSAAQPQAPAFRLAENFFQRWALILLPVLLLTVLGFMLSQRISADYMASSTLSTAANPLVGTQEIRGATLGFLESPAQATSRVMTEQLGTDLFARNVANRAGLTEAIDDGFLEYDDIRSRISVFATGEALVDIEALWSDPETSLALVDAIITEYQSLLQSTLSTDAQAAVDFYQDRRDEAVALASVAEAELEAFEDSLPVQWEVDDLPFADELRFRRLNDRLLDAQAGIDEADDSIEEALLAVAQAESEAGRSIQVIDPPSSSFLPESTLRDKIIILFGFTLLGGLMSLTILLLSTYLDKSVRSAADIEAAGAGGAVVTVPLIRSLRNRRGIGGLIDNIAMRISRSPRAL